MSCMPSESVLKVPCRCLGNGEVRVDKNRVPCIAVG